LKPFEDHYLRQMLQYHHETIQERRQLDMKKMVFVLAACLLFAAPAMAKEGFYIGAFIPTETISGDAGAGLDSGPGWGFRAGYGVNRYLSFEGKYATTKHDIQNTSSSMNLKSLAADVKLNFPLTSLDRAQVMTVEPYLSGGIAHYESTYAGSTAKSDGFQWGFGVELYLFKELSVQAGWTRSEVSFDSTPKRDGNVKTVDFGVIYHFL
jgi:hypothetical protein